MCNNAIPQDYTRVEVHTVKPEFMKWKIEHPTPEGLDLLGDVMSQFILWHKKDNVLTACLPTSSDVHLKRVVEDGDSPVHDDHTPKMPHSSRILATTCHSLLQLAPSKGLTRHRMCLTSHKLQPSPARTE
jgi:hypothetical protein